MTSKRVQKLFDKYRQQRKSMKELSVFVDVFRRIFAKSPPSYIEIRYIFGKMCIYGNIEHSKYIYHGYIHDIDIFTPGLFGKICQYDRNLAIVKWFVLKLDGNNCLNYIDGFYRACKYRCKSIVKYLLNLRIVYNISTFYSYHRKIRTYRKSYQRFCDKSVNKYDKWLYLCIFRHFLDGSPSSSLQMMNSDTMVSMILWFLDEFADHININNDWMFIIKYLCVNPILSTSGFIQILRRLQLIIIAEDIKDIFALIFALNRYDICIWFLYNNIDVYNDYSDVLDCIYKFTYHYLCPFKIPSPPQPQCDLFKEMILQRCKYNSVMYHRNGHCYIVHEERERFDAIVNYSDNINTIVLSLNRNIIK